MAWKLQPICICRIKVSHLFYCFTRQISAGEYLETAPKFLKTGYNCLAVDLRSGKEVNYIQNETAKKAREQNLPADYIDDEKDIIAAINYVKQYTADKIILAGSMYSGSLALLAANNNPAVIAVIAFSPGEYFEPVHSINKELTGFNKPVFISSTKTEYPFIKEMVAGIPGQLITWYVPTKGEGTQGSRILWSSDADSEECWMSILMFFKNLEPLPGRK